MTPPPTKSGRKEKIIARRIALGLSQGDLAARIGYDQSTIQRLETGKRRLKDYQYEALARALQCRVSDLVDNDVGVASVDPGVEEAAKILYALSPDQRALWFQVGHSFIVGSKSR